MQATQKNSESSRTASQSTTQQIHLYGILLFTTTESCAAEIRHASFVLRVEERFCLKHGVNSFLRNFGSRAAPTVSILHTLNQSSSIKHKESLNI
jgi:hypothetical protein